MVYIWNPGRGEVSGRPKVQGHPWLFSEFQESQHSMSLVLKEDKTGADKMAWLGT